MKIVPDVSISSLNEGKLVIETESTVAESGIRAGGVRPGALIERITVDRLPRRYTSHTLHPMLWYITGLVIGIFLTNLIVGELHMYWNPRTFMNTVEEFHYFVLGVMVTVIVVVPLAAYLIIREAKK